MEVFAVPISFLPAFAISLLFLASAIASPEATATADPSSTLARQQLAKRWIEALHLTPEQVEQLKAIPSRYYDQLHQIEGQLQQAERELNQLMMSAATVPAIQDKQQQLETLKIKAAALYFEEALVLRGVLSPTQRRQLGARLLPQAEGVQ